MKFSVLFDVLILSSVNMLLRFIEAQNIVKSLGGNISENRTDDHSSEYIKRIMNADIYSGIAYRNANIKTGALSEEKSMLRKIARHALLIACVEGND